MKEETERLQKYVREFGHELPIYLKSKLDELRLNLASSVTYESALTTIRKITEWVLREIYAKEVGTSAEKLGEIRLDQMIRELKNVLPFHHSCSIETLRAIGNYHSHPQKDSHAQGGSIDINEDNVALMVKFMFQVIEFYRDYIKDTFKENATPPVCAETICDQPLIIGVDFGTHKISAGLVSFAQDLPEVIVKKTLLHDPIARESGIIQQIESLVILTLDAAGISSNQLNGIGVGLPGQVDYRTGFLKFAPGLQCRSVNVSTKLATKFGIPVYSDNDVNCSTLAELRWGHGRLFKSFVCVYIGTGIGAGIVINGSLLRGSTYSAGEIGHMKIDCSESARRCTCMAKGCFEEYASARAIVRLARDAIHEAKDRRINNLLANLDPQTVTTFDIVEAIRSKDEVSIRLAEKIAEFLAIGLSNVANFLNPEAIILGGGVVNGFYGFDFFNEVFSRKFRGLALDVCSNTDILLASFEEDGPVIGAASLSYFGTNNS